MASLSGILSTGRSALMAHQTAVAVTSQNISNAETEGYSRQRVSLTPNEPLRTPSGMLGTGVKIDNITRARDSLLDATYRRENGKSASFSLQSSVLSQVEDVFGEPSETGIGASLDRFWSSWSDLASNPTNASARLMVQQRGSQLATGLNSASARLAEVADSVRLQLSNSVKEVNQLTSQLAEINVQIVSAESNGTMANELRDTRDSVLDRLAHLTGARSFEQSNGSAVVTMGGTTLVQGSSSVTLQQPTISGGEWTISSSSGNVVGVDQDQGEIGGLMRLLNTDLPEISGDLDKLAQELVSTINTLHRQGWSEEGEAAGLGDPEWVTPPTGSGIDFFDESGGIGSVSAATIRLSAEVEGDAQVIAVGYTEGATADNQLALDIAALRSADSIGALSFNDHYRDVVTGVGLRASAADNSASVFGTLSTQADVRRMSTSGVSVDEELVKLIQFQQGYTAASRLITTVDEMMETLLRM